MPPSSSLGANGAKLVASLPGDGTFNDDTALFPNLGTGVPTTIAWTDFCVSARGVVPSTASQTLFVEDCNGDPAQIWTVNENPMTVSNADGNCITLGRAALGVEVRVFASTAIRNGRVNRVVRCSFRFHLRRARTSSNIFSSGIQR